MPKPHILIFDFDGTIADTHHYIINIANRLCEEFHYKPIHPDEIEALKDKTSQEIIRLLKVPLLKIPAILARAKKEFHKGISNIQPIDGLTEILSQLNEQNFSMGILSSNSCENITKFLAENDLDFFNFIHTTSNVWGKNKSLKKLIKELEFTADDIIYIGDETRDITAAKKLGVKVAAVTWGYNSSKVLEKHHPHFIVHSPEELFELCMQLEKEPA
ncbi:MAG: HAD-IA family hydrolase [Candidatus Omnitrophica bacterium]|nr:HAD-IA family hydrolase [Candidatus Omnitrophota bacterium]